MHLCSMANILCIETSGTVCSVALFDDSANCLGYEKEEASFQHAAVATVLIDKLLTQCNIDIKQLDAVALSAGPGSYTGLRIGTSVAKGLCYALDVPLIAINTLALLASGFIKNNVIAKNDLICPAIDARRMEIYTAIYDTELHCELLPTPLIITPDVFAEALKEADIHLVGSGAKKTFEEINHPKLKLNEGDYLSAKNMGKLAVDKWLRKDFADTAYFEPDYLKAFHTTAKVK